MTRLLQLIIACTICLTVFSDNTALSAGPNNRIAMEQFSFDSKSFKGNLLARMDRDALLVISGDIVHHCKNVVKNRRPSVVLGLRAAVYSYHRHRART